MPKAGQSTPEILINMEKYKKVASLFQQAVIPSAHISWHDAHLVCNNMTSLFVSILFYALFALRALFGELLPSSFMPVLYLFGSFSLLKFNILHLSLLIFLLFWRPSSSFFQVVSDFE